MKTDKQLYIDIMEKLEFDPAIDPSNITLAVHDGIVTLGGNVNSYAEKRLVQRAVRKIEGVKGIANEIEVELNPSWKHSDTEIAKAAVHTLNWDTTLPKDQIKVTVEKGQVILTGEVDWWYQKQNAEKDVRYLTGVIGVDNQIIVNPKMEIVDPSDVKQKIQKEFARNALIDAQGISIEVEGSKITLHGQIKSWAEFKEAADAAWSIPGVTQVDNQLTIGI